MVGTELNESDAAAFAEAVRLRVEKDIEGSLVIHRSLMSRNPDNAGILYSLGLVYLGLFDEDRATFCFEQAAALEPRNANMLKRRAATHRRIEATRQRAASDGGQ